MAEPKLGYIYFAEAKEVNMVKIGWSSNHPDSRLHSFTTGSPVDVTRRAYIRGEPHVERELHERFRHLRMKGEWFRFSAELRQFIDTHAEKWEKQGRKRRPLTAKQQQDADNRLAKWASKFTMRSQGFAFTAIELCQRTGLPLDTLKEWRDVQWEGTEIASYIDDMVEILKQSQGSREPKAISA